MLVIHFAVVPQILKDALHVTSQNIEAEMAKTLKLAFEYTGEVKALWPSYSRFSFTTIISSLLMLTFHSGVLMHIIESPHPPPVQPPLLVMKQSLINCRQHEAFIKVLMVS